MYRSGSRASSLAGPHFAHPPLVDSASSHTPRTLKSICRVRSFLWLKFWDWYQ
ncbi:hypothetical protein [Azospirillum palustre]